MDKIHLLDSDTINQIAAGEVVERPASVVKELVENAIDAGATAVTVEIKEGGINLIRVTDNGSGIKKEEIPLAFCRHATSKIETAEDLLAIRSLGFRGEALSSISAVAMVELITKTREDFVGCRYEINGGEEKGLTEAGAPDGTTFLIRNLFYNVPARRKFLKSAMTEAGYVEGQMERFALSHPEIAVKFINNNKTTLQTSGNGNMRDCIYHIYGREVANALLPIDVQQDDLSIVGFIGKPIVSRGNRTYENYFVNGRFIKSNVLAKAIEEAYKPYTMQHKYPFTVLLIDMPSEKVDVNVHPTKLEVRFANSETLYQFVHRSIADVLKGKNMIPDALLTEEKKSAKRDFEATPEQFETNRIEAERKTSLPSSNSINKSFQTGSNNGSASSNRDYIRSQAEKKRDDAIQKTLNSNLFAAPSKTSNSNLFRSPAKEPTAAVRKDVEEKIADTDIGKLMQVREGNVGVTNHSDVPVQESNANMQQNSAIDDPVKYPDRVQETSAYATSQSQVNAIEAATNSAANEQISLFETTEKNKEAFMEKKEQDHHRIIGQLFATYWLVEYNEQLFMIDQHAAHEKILYEHTVAKMESKEMTSQMVSPPIILTLSLREEEVLKRYMTHFEMLGYQIEHFGGREYAVSAIPADFYGIDGEVLLTEMLDDLLDNPPSGTPDIVLHKIATMSCKAAVKGNMKLSEAEAKALINELLSLENPFHCPHGRPVIVSMTKHEIEKKFKRIVE